MDVRTMNLAVIGVIFHYSFFFFSTFWIDIYFSLWKKTARTTHLNLHIFIKLTCWLLVYCGHHAITTMYLFISDVCLISPSFINWSPISLRNNNNSSIRLKTKLKYTEMYVWQIKCTCFVKIARTCYIIIIINNTLLYGLSKRSERVSYWGEVNNCVSSCFCVCAICTRNGYEQALTHKTKGNSWQNG